MDGTKATAAVDSPIDATLLDKLLTNQLSEAEARSFLSGDPECVVFTLLALQQRIAGVSQSTGPNTPSSVIPPYGKPPTKPSKSKKKRGGQPGHTGRTRPPLGAHREPVRTFHDKESRRPATG
jgi:transposase